MCMRHTLSRWIYFFHILALHHFVKSICIMYICGKKSLKKCALLDRCKKKFFPFCTVYFFPSMCCVFKSVGMSMLDTMEAEKREVFRFLVSKVGQTEGKMRRKKEFLCEQWDWAPKWRYSKYFFLIPFRPHSLLSILNFTFLSSAFDRSVFMRIECSNNIFRITFSRRNMPILLDVRFSRLFAFNNVKYALFANFIEINSNKIWICISCCSYGMQF